MIGEERGAEQSEEPTDRLPAAAPTGDRGADASREVKARPPVAGRTALLPRPPFAALASPEAEERMAAARELMRLCEEGEAVAAEVIPGLQEAYRHERSVGQAAKLRGIINRLQTLHQALTQDAPDGAGVGRAAAVLYQHLHPRYLLDALVAATRMSEVYCAWRAADGQQVAIKCLPQKLVREAARQQFVEETELLLHLRHPHIVPVLDRGLAGEMPFFVMEYVAGGSLRDHMGKRTMNAERVIRIGVEVCDALAHAHAQGVVHLDVKPGNILLDDLDRARLSDFGIARVADARKETVAVAGTRGYAAPEQLSPGYQPDPRSDIYSLGVVLYRVLTGRVPATPLTPATELARGLPRELDAVLERALCRKPGDRFPDAVSFGAALGACLPDYAQLQVLADNVWRR